MNELPRSLLDFYLKTAHLTSLAKLTKIVSGNISEVTMDAMQHCASAIAEQNLARLLMEVHKTKKHDIFHCLKRRKCEALTILRKHNHKNRTIEEFVQGIFNFQCFERNDMLFLNKVDWDHLQVQLNSMKKSNSNKP